MQTTLSLVTKRKGSLRSPFVKQANPSLSRVYSDFHFMDQLMLVIHGIKKVKHRLLGIASDPNPGPAYVVVAIQKHR